MKNGTFSLIKLWVNQLDHSLTCMYPSSDMWEKEYYSLSAITVLEQNSNYFSHNLENKSKRAHIRSTVVPDNVHLLLQMTSYIFKWLSWTFKSPHCSPALLSLISAGTLTEPMHLQSERFPVRSACPTALSVSQRGPAPTFIAFTSRLRVHGQKQKGLHGAWRLKPLLSSMQHRKQSTSHPVVSHTQHDHITTREGEEKKKKKKNRRRRKRRRKDERKLTSLSRKTLELVRDIRRWRRSRSA